MKQSRAARKVSKMLLEMNSDGEDKATPQRFVSRRKSAPRGGDSDDDEGEDVVFEVTLPPSGDEADSDEEESDAEEAE